MLGVRVATYSSRLAVKVQAHETVLVVLAEHSLRDVEVVRHLGSRGGSWIGVDVLESVRGLAAVLGKLG